MRAVLVSELGGPEVLVPTELPAPSPGRGQVAIDVAYANVTFVETQLRAGRGPMQLDPPVVMGNGVGGTVSAVGPHVDATLLGSRVVATTGGRGGYAEVATAAADAVYPVPDGLPLDRAVAVLADGRTATLLVDTARVGRGDRVLVEAAAGGVGSLLVQLASARGAHVIAAAGGDAKLRLAAELGAEVTVDYGLVDWPDLVRARVGGVDVVFDGVGGEVARAAFSLLGRGGRMVSYGLASGAWADVPRTTAHQRGIELLHLAPTPEELRAATRSALEAAAEGRLRPVIGQRFALTQAAAAHAAIERRATVGKTLLEARPA